jgi:hypothetical protein
MGPLFEDLLRREGFAPAKGGKSSPVVDGPTREQVEAVPEFTARSLSCSEAQSSIVIVPWYDSVLSPVYLDVGR